MARVDDASLLTPDEVAAYLKVRRETVYAYIRGKELRATRLGREYRVDRADLDAFVDCRSTREPTPAERWARLRAVGERNAGIPPDEVERDVAAAVTHARHDRGA